MDKKQLKLMMAASLTSSDASLKASDVQKDDAARSAMQKVEKIFKANETSKVSKLTRADSNAEDWLEDDSTEKSADDSSTC